MRILALTIIMVFSLALHAQLQSEWRGIGRTGNYTSETGLLKMWPTDGPELLWHIDSLPKGYSSIAIANSKVITTGTIDTIDVIIAFDMNGNKLWQTAFGRAWDGSYEFCRSTPTIENNKIYVSSGLGDVSCLNLEDGKMVWSVKTVEKFAGQGGRFGFAESISIYNDIVMFTIGGDATTTVALNKNNGDLVWKSESLNDAASYTSPLIIDYKSKKQVLNVSEKYLFSLNPENGDLLWKFDFGSYADRRNNQTNTPLYYNGEIFVTSGYDHKSVMLSLADDGLGVKVKWVDSVLDNHYGGVVRIDNYIYGSNWIHNRMGNWVCLNWNTGEQMYSTEWINKGAVIAADGMLYCYEEKTGNVGIAAINPEKFEIISSFKLPYGEGPYWSHPVIDKGLLYIRNTSALMVYKIKE